MAAAAQAAPEAPTVEVEAAMGAAEGCTALGAAEGKAVLEAVKGVAARAVVATARRNRRRLWRPLAFLSQRYRGYWRAWLCLSCSSARR